MDPTGPASATGPLILRAAILLFAGCCSAFATEQAPAQEGPTETVQQLFAERRWPEVVRLAEAAPKRSAELNYYYGVALAHLERWDEARRALLLGSRMQPGDKRFLIELGGVAFKQRNYPKAAGYLRRALRLDPTDSYANEFLATVYFLDGNLEAALKYWNRVGKPEIEESRLEPLPRVDPVLLDRAFAFSPADTLHLRQLLATEARVRGLEIFPNFRFDLLARPDGNFDTVFRAQERNGWGSSKLEALVGLFRALPYQQIDPEYFNLRGSATNIVSLVRWDAQKRRVLASVSGPIGRDPKWHYRFGVDLRNENWLLRDSFRGPILAGLSLRRQGLNAELTRLVGERWVWSARAQLSHRAYRNVFPGVGLGAQLLADGYQLKCAAPFNYEVWGIPEKRFTVSTRFSPEVGRIWSKPVNTFAKLQASLNFHWLPHSEGDDYETRWQISSGKTFGQTPFDELFMLGLERDNDLWLRAHIGTRGGRKGSAPLGRNYFLSNWESDKNIYRKGFFTLKLGPFLDTGKITDGSSSLGTKKWLWDTGVQAKVGVLGVTIVISYGKDLRTGNNAFYTTVAR